MSPGGGAVFAVEQIELAQPVLYFLEEAGVINRYCQLVGHRAQCGYVLIAEGCFLGGLHIQRANDLTAHAQWQRYFRARLGQVGIDKVRRVRPHVERDAGIPCTGDVTDHTHLAHRQFVAAFQHPSATLGGSGLQDGVLSPVVHEKDTGVVKTESLRDEVYRLVEQLVHVADGRGFAGHLGRGLHLDGLALQVVCALGHTSFQVLH